MEPRLGTNRTKLTHLFPPNSHSMSELKTAVLGGHFSPIPSVYSRDLGLVIARMLTPAAKDRPTAAYVHLCRASIHT